MSKNRLDLDLEFLKENTPKREEEATKSRYRTNWKNILIITVIAGGLVGLALFQEPKPASAPQSVPAPAWQVQSEKVESDNLVTHGQFRCSRYYSDQARLLAPAANLGALNAEDEALKLRSDRLKSLKAELENQKAFGLSSQGEIDRYNAVVDQYNSTLNALRQDHASYQLRVRAFNNQVDAYNNYPHCQRRY
jgi:hypothetical protein